MPWFASPARQSKVGCPLTLPLPQSGVLLRLGTRLGSVHPLLRTAHVCRYGCLLFQCPSLLPLAQEAAKRIGQAPLRRRGRLRRVALAS